MLVEAEDEGAVGQQPFHDRKATLTEIAEPGVVMAALGIVVVRDHRHGQTERCQQIEPVEPVRIGTRLVQLVHRHGRDPERERCGARERDCASASKLLGEEVADRRTCPLSQRIGGAPRAGEHEPRPPDTGERRLAFERGRRLEALQPCYADAPAEARVEVGDGLCGELVGVLLEPERRVEEHGGNFARIVHFEAFENHAMRLHHRRRRLTAPHDRQQAGHRGPPSRARSSSVSANSSGCWAWMSWSAGENHRTRPSGNNASAASTASRLS